MKAINRETALQIPEGIRSLERIDAQTLEPLPQPVDLYRRPILGRLFAQLSELCASQRRVALDSQVRDAFQGNRRFECRWWGRRGFEQLVHALGTCPNPMAKPELLTYRDPARRSMRQTQFLDYCEDGGIGNLLRSSHARRLR